MVAQRVIGVKTIAAQLQRGSVSGCDPRIALTGRSVPCVYSGIAGAAAAIAILAEQPLLQTRRRPVLCAARTSWQESPPDRLQQGHEKYDEHI